MFDGLVSLAIFLAISTLVVLFEAAEIWNEFSAQYEDWELDEVPGLFLALCVSLIWLLIRRNADRRQTHESLKQSYAAQHAAIESERERNTEAQLIGELNEWLQTCRSLGELYDIIGAFFSRLLPHCKGSIYVYSNSRDALDGVCSWNDGTLKTTMAPDDCWALRRGRTYIRGANAIDFVCAHARGGPAADCCIPIVAHGETIGLITLEFEQDEAEASAAATQHQVRLALVCAERVSLGIANVRLRDQLRDQSIQDALTGLYNRRYMLETLRREIARAKRNDRALSILSLDIDHFKQFNDNHGHDAGDMVLRSVGERLSSQCRGEDAVCRVGGEEFIVILPEATLDGAHRKAQALLSLFEDMVIRYGDHVLPRITVSIGIATYPQSGEYPQELLKTADEWLYRAKENGRNRVESPLARGCGDAPGRDHTPTAAPAVEIAPKASPAQRPPAGIGLDEALAAAASGQP